NVTSGIRLGTPAMTTRGFKEQEIAKAVEAIALILDNPTDAVSAEKAGKIVQELCAAYPLYK
ncbi:MAG TPA: serine hydroxymethyltransferase, partial [Anaerovoracaceae bacterium]|nr:serine hydroxymethyltransferase [Anaerovoracaceae bacterium]